MRLRRSGRPWTRLALVPALVLLTTVLVALAGGVAARAEERPVDYTTNADLPSDFALGLEASRMIAANFGLIESDSLVRRINDIGYRVALGVGRPDILFTFQILNMDEPNAMALPGGWVFVTKGILDIGLTDAELAHLLGHEISHVTHKDFSRQGRLDGLLSLLQTALMVAISLAGPSSPNSGPVIEAPGSYGYPQTSADAALQGSVVFGSVFHELLLRGYSRKLEMEADDGGRRLASLAGYSRLAGESLMVKLHDRIYEDREYGYWRTHPYFVDRVASARAVRPGADVGPSTTEVAAYRLGIQQGLASAAGAFKDERVASYLFELAMRTGTTEGSGFAVHRGLLRFRADRIGRRPPLLRSYGPLRVQFDSLLATGVREGVDSQTLDALRASRDSIEAMRVDLLPKVLDAMADPGASIPLLEAFVRNYPERPEAGPIRLRLARAYRSSSRPDLAIERLTAFADGTTGNDQVPSGAAFGDSTILSRGRAEILRTLPQIGDPEIVQGLLDRAKDPEILTAAAARMEALADTLERIEMVGRFVQTHASSPLAPRFRQRLITLAEAEYKKGRLAEAMGDQQSALSTYNRIAILAPDTPSATESRRGIVRIQTLANSDR
jgi:Zn-dependent protease with chaperone function